MRRRNVTWTWEDPDAQEAFAEWVGFPDEQQSSEEIDRIEALLQLRPPLRALDVGCGTGRHALEMARRGYQVVGIDVAESYLDEARGEAGRQALAIEFRLQRGSELSEKESYDFILAYNHTLGFMADDELIHHFESIRAALKPSGTFLLVLAGPRLILGHVSQGTKNWVEKNGKFILTEKYMENDHRIEHCIVIDTNSEEITEYHERQRAFSLDDVRSLLQNAGFGRADCFKDLDGHRATPEDFGVFACYRPSADDIF